MFLISLSFGFCRSFQSSLTCASTHQTRLERPAKANTLAYYQHALNILNSKLQYFSIAVTEFEPTMSVFWQDDDLGQYLDESPVLMKEKVQADNCAMCQYAMHYVYEILQNKDDQEEIR